MSKNFNNSFPARLKEAIGQRSNSSFSKDCDLSEGVIRKYLLGESEPTLSRLIAISKASGVSIEWLATGEGEVRPSAGHSFGNAKQHLVEMWFGFFDSEKERFEPTETGLTEHKTSIDGPNALGSCITNIDDDPNLSVCGVAGQFVHLYNRGYFGAGLIPDWIFKIIPTLDRDEFERWIREALRDRVEAGTPMLREIIPTDLLPNLEETLKNMAKAIEQFYGVSLELLPNNLKQNILRDSIYPTLIRLGAHRYRAPSVEGIKHLLGVAVELGSIPPP